MAASRRSDSSASASRWVVAAFAVAAAVLLLVGRASRDSDDPTPSAQTVAHVRYAVDASGTFRSARDDETFPIENYIGSVDRGTIRLDRGLFQLRTTLDTRIVAEAPAVFTMVDESTLRLKRGRVYVRVGRRANKNTASQFGTKFTVQTDRLRVDDLGTAFGVDVSVERTDVEVTEGAVRVISNQAGETVKPATLYAGELLHCDGSGVWVRQQNQTGFNHVRSKLVGSRTNPAVRLSTLDQSISSDRDLSHETES